MRYFDTFPDILNGRVLDNGLMPFTRELIPAKIIRRPNRFIVIVDVNGVEQEAHCPTTGSIGGWKLDGLDALLAGPFKTSHRRTEWTLEAIRVPIVQGGHQWVGVNQSNANRYVEAALLSGQMSDAAGAFKLLYSEHRLGESRLDFMLDMGNSNRTYIEVKTPLKVINLDADVESNPTASPFADTDRLVKHIDDLASALEGGDKAILMSCFMYDAPPFNPPSHSYTRVSESLSRAGALGLERWQVNFSLCNEGVQLQSLLTF